jgi:hypothetical protein
MLLAARTEGKSAQEIDKLVAKQIEAKNKEVIAKKELDKYKANTVKIENLKDPKNAIEEKVKSLKNMLYATKGTNVNKFIEKLTAYNDIANRAVIQDKMMADVKKGVKIGKYRNKAARDKAEDDVLNYLDMLFVNYSYLDPKSVKFMNDIGLLMFTKFFFRVAKAELKAASKNPMAYLTFNAVDAFMIDLESPTDQYKHPLDTFFNKVGKADAFTIAQQIVEPRIFQPITGS